MISVLILTLNEEINLPACLRSIQWSDDIVVFDSYSTDSTVEIAKAAEVRVIQRQFDDYANQRNAALTEIDYKHPWLLMIDADEVVPKNLAEEIKQIVESDDPATSLYRVRRKDFFLGHWIKRSSGYPTWFGRFIRVGHVKVERAINEEFVTDGKTGYLKHHLHHYPFNKGFSAWLEKHNRYSTMEAELLVKGRSGKINLSELLSKDPARRRKVIKEIVYRLPGRPALMFFALYIVRRGFLDGVPGLTFCLLRSFYEFMINCKVKEIKRRQEGLPL